MRGFSTIEILIALAVLTTTTTAVALVAYGTPFMLANMKMESAALYAGGDELSRIEHSAWNGLNKIEPVASSTVDDIEHSLTVETNGENGAIHAHADASWIDAYGSKRSSTLTTFLYDSSTDNPCDPFVSSTWTTPQNRTYTLSVDDLLGAGIAQDTYPVSDVHTVENTLIVAVRATGRATSSTLFFFDIAQAAQRPVLIGNGFDNAPTSRVGFTALAAGDGYAYAANGFGSASASICSDSISCAQLQVFSLPTILHVPALTSSLTLATSSAPYAKISGGSTAPATAITYSYGLIYLGLQKTISGDEFNIIDIHDPAHPHWVSGVPIGRSVNRILIHDDVAYIATDDNAQELIAIDVHDPLHPFIIGRWNASGSTGFGFGTALRIFNSTLLFGRSYVSNAPELSALAISDPKNISELSHQNIGNILNPDSIRAFVPQDFLTFVLAAKKLQFWKLVRGADLAEFAPSLSLPPGSTGTSLACRGNILYVGLEQISQGTGAIEVITNS